MSGGLLLLLCGLGAGVVVLGAIGSVLLVRAHDKHTATQVQHYDRIIQAESRRTK